MGGNNTQNILPHKFEKGKSGNPKGRTPGTLGAKTIIKRWLEAKEKAKNPLSNKDELLTQMDIIALAQLAKARKGDTAAFNALLDRTEGKPKQGIIGIDEEGNDAPLSITLNLG